MSDMDLVIWGTPHTQDLFPSSIENKIASMLYKGEMVRIYNYRDFSLYCRSASDNVTNHFQIVFSSTLSLLA